MTNTATSTPTQTPTPTETFTPTPSETATQTPTSTLTPTVTPDPRRFYAPDNTFSLEPPEDWEPEEVGSFAYPVLFGPDIGGFKLNLIFMQEESPFPMAFYSALVQDSVLENFQNLTQIREDFLVTDEGKDYFRWEVTNLQEGVMYLQILYFFESGDWKLVITYTRLKDQGAENDILIDEAMTTVRFTH